MSERLFFGYCYTLLIWWMDTHTEIYAFLANALRKLNSLQNFSPYHSIWLYYTYVVIYYVMCHTFRTKITARLEILTHAAIFTPATGLLAQKLTASLRKQPLNWLPLSPSSVLSKLHKITSALKTLWKFLKTPPGVIFLNYSCFLVTVYRL